MNDKNIQIEVEWRALLTEQEYKRIFNILSAKAQDLGDDNKDVWFYVFDDKLLKVCNNVSKRTAKIVYKSGKIHHGPLKEIEININPREFDQAARLFSLLGAKSIMRSFQKRHNYLLKGVEIALKYSDHWNYHLEMEIVVDNSEKIVEAEKKIFQTAQELNVTLMTNEEIKNFTDKFESEFCSVLDSI